MRGASDDLHYYKPYFATQPDGSLRLMGQPVPRSHLMYFRDHWLVHNLWLARLATNTYMRLKYPKVIVPDPSEKLVGKMRDFVEGNGGKFMVGIQSRDEALVRYLEASRIPFVKPEGAAFIPEFKENIWGTSPESRGPEGRCRPHLRNAGRQWRGAGEAGDGQLTRRRTASGRCRPIPGTCAGPRGPARLRSCCGR